MKKQKSSLKLHLFSGFHDPGLSEQFAAVLHAALAALMPAVVQDVDIAVYPMGTGPSLVGEGDRIHLFIGFSAGVITAAIAATLAQFQGQSVAGLIALDGWGVVLCDRSIPVFRLSHDAWTHLTSSFIGGRGIFFADPPVKHLTLWAQPDAVKGWYSLDANDPIECCADLALARLIQSLLQRLY